MKKWFLAVTFIFTMSLLSGCDQLDEILEKINQILDQEIEQQTSEKGTNRANDGNDAARDNATNENTEINGDTDDDRSDHNEVDNSTENTDDDTMSYLDRIKSGEVEPYDLPNGFPFPIPEDWYLIQLHNDGAHPVTGEEYWEGSFYFESDDMPRAAYDFQNMLHGMGYDTDSESNYEGTPDYEYVMTYDGNEPGAGSGIVKFYYNEEDGACVAIIYLTFD